MVGIDLGTTNSLVAVFDGNEARVLTNEMGAALTPSAVAVSEDGRVLVGSAARDRLVVAPDSGKTQFKRDMGESVHYHFGGHSWTPVECSALVLQEMKRIAEMELGKEVNSAVITVPAYFRDEQRSATLDAARMAGLKVDRIINEPTAAALALGYKNPDAESTLLVFDLGGGTFDATLLEAYDGIIEVKSSAGVSHLGGEDFTDAFAQWVLEKSGWQPKREDERRWRQHVEMVKRRLSKQDKATITLGNGELEVTLQDLAEATRSVSERIYPVVARCLRDAGVSFQQLDDILLIGGATRDRNLLERITRESGRLPNRKLDPDQVVAMGAAIQAALCLDDAAVEDIVLTDVCPHTLGIEVSRMSAPGRPSSGYFAPIIDRNTTVPVSRADVFHTLSPEQDEIRLRVFQGESRKVSENRQIGEVLVKNMRRREGQKRPGEAEVRFSYDMNGMLEVEVTVLHSGEKTNCIIQQNTNGLSDEEIRAALEKLAPLKIHPRDKLEHRARIERANRLFKELLGVQRDELTYRLEQFEVALESQDEKEINIASHALDTFLAPFFSLDGEFEGSLKF